MPSKDSGCLWSDPTFHCSLWTTLLPFQTACSPSKRPGGTVQGYRGAAKVAASTGGPCLHGGGRDTASCLCSPPPVAESLSLPQGGPAERVARGGLCPDGGSFLLVRGTGLDGRSSVVNERRRPARPCCRLGGGGPLELPPGGRSLGAAFKGASWRGTSKALPRASPPPAKRCLHPPGRGWSLLQRSSPAARAGPRPRDPRRTLPRAKGSLPRRKRQTRGQPHQTERPPTSAAACKGAARASPPPDLRRWPLSAPLSDPSSPAEARRGPRSSPPGGEKNKTATSAQPAYLTGWL